MTGDERGRAEAAHGAVALEAPTRLATREPPEDGMGWDDPAEGYRAEMAAVALHHKISAQTLPVRSYIDATVTPLLIQALLALGKERPSNPVDWLAAYLLQNDPARAERGS
ncbi:hypothetical protein T492DRAFT_1036118 [Pavlovales sp. CCMP2436]|nr:hypothetical protein T492DRAFT_1036118 [Pavlovales sp. CCMP2436]